MVANLENTVRKWRVVHNVLLRAGKISQRGGNVVIYKNAPSVNLIYGLYEPHNVNLQTNQEARNYFQNHPHMRKHITKAYNRLNNVNNQLNSVARKIVAARKIQRISRMAIKKKKNTAMLSAFLVTRRFLPRNMNMARTELLGKIYHNLHASKTAYGPKTEMNALRNRPKYPTY